MSASDRVQYADVPGTDELFTPEFLEYITAAYDKFAPSTCGHTRQARRHDRQSGER